METVLPLLCRGMYPWRFLRRATASYTLDLMNALSPFVPGSCDVGVFLTACTVHTAKELSRGVYMATPASKNRQLRTQPGGDYIPLTANGSCDV